MIEPALLKVPISSPALISIKDYRMASFDLCCAAQ
jgi:hypothetical protein